MHQAAFRALTQCHRNQNNFLEKTSHLQFSEFKKYLEQDREWFACVQKKRFALGKLDTIIGKEMEQRQGEADAYLIPEEIAIHATWRPEMTDHYIAGDFGPARVNALPGPSRGSASGDTQGTLERVEPLHMIKQFPAYLVKSRIPQGATEEEVMNLARVRQIGEYFPMLENCDHTGDYKSKHRHILIFDEEENDMVEIGLKTALNNCPIFDGNGNIKPVIYSAKQGAAQWDDLDKDFLMTKVGDRTEKSTGHHAVRCIGDMDPYFLPTNFLICAAKSMRNLFPGLGKNITESTTIPANWDSPIANWLLQSSSSNTVAKLLENAAGVAAITVNPNNTKTSDTPTSFVASQVDDGFLQAVMVGIPQAKRDEVKPIIENRNISVIARTEQVRDKVLEYVNSGVAGMKASLKSEDKVHEWYGKLKSEYTKMKAEEQISSSSSGKQSSSIGSIVGYVPIGTDLTGTGYEFVGRLDDESNLQGGRGKTAGTYKEAGKNIGDLKILAKHAEGIRNTAEPLVIKLLAALYLLIKMDRPTLNALVEKDIRIPMNFLLFRPHMQYLTRAIIKCKQNGGTGVMLTGHDNFMMSWESGRMSGQMHYTTHIRPFIYNPENVYVKADVYVQGCEGGAGSRFYSVDTYKQKDMRELVNSLICVAIPVIETKFPLPMDICGRFHTQYTMEMEGQGQFERQMHYSTAPRFTQEFNFGKGGKQGSDVPPMMPGRHHDNTVCYPGHRQLWDTTRNAFSNVKVGQGHWGKDVYPGCADIRRGSLDVLETQNYANALTN
jgi:hypothetical protein